MDSVLPSSLSNPLNRSSQPSQDKQPSSSFKCNTIDDYFSKIGFGIYQIRAYLILGFVLINDGAEVIVLSFLFSILTKEWGLTTGQIGFLGSTVFVGFFFGSLISGKISDTYGRKNALVYIVLLLYVFGMWSAFVNTFAMLVFVRTVFGFLVGIQFPMCITYLTEITPKEVRGKWLVLAGGFFTLGEFLACFIAFFTLDSSSSGNWRALFIWVAQPAVLCALGIKYLMHESPRYEIVVKKSYNGGLRILENIAKVNGVSLELNEEDADRIKKHLESSKTPAQNEEKTASFSMLLKGKFKMISLYLWPIWMVLSLVYYGMVYILPMALAALGNSSSGEDIWSVVLAVCSEVPSIVFGFFMVENSKFGRKNSLVYGFAGCSIACLFAGVLGSFVLWVSVARGVINFAFTIIYPYTAELYPTTIRTTGLGTASAASKVGGMLMPWITLSLFDVGPKVPFIGFCIFCALGAFCCYKLPYDTTNKELDAVEVELELGELPKAKN